MRIACAFGVGIAVMTGAAQAEAPPLWAYLAECSAVFDAVSRSDGYGGAKPEDLIAARDTGARFLARAIVVAGEMGQANPEEDVASIMGYLTPRWENRIERLFSVKSNLDWIDYCRRLGLEQGVIPYPATP
jgi:hypothetical protein